MNLIISDNPIEIYKENRHIDIENIDLSTKSIANCIGCFSCWVKTPSKCIIRDDAIKIYPLVASSENLIYVTRVKYGTYDTILKTFLERTIPTQQAFIRLYNGEAHHVQRNVNVKNAIIVAYGDLQDDEKEIFTNLVNRNAHNMNFGSHKVIFTKFEDLNDIINKEVVLWKR